MTETRRKEVDECSCFRGEVAAVRIDGMDRRLLRRVLRQQTDQAAGHEVLAPYLTSVAFSTSTVDRLTAVARIAEEIRINAYEPAADARTRCNA